jgi:hypothetical protein
MQKKKKKKKKEKTTRSCAGVKSLSRRDYAVLEIRACAIQARNESRGVYNSAHAESISDAPSTIRAFARIFYVHVQIYYDDPRTITLPPLSAFNGRPSIYRGGRGSG